MKHNDGSFLQDKLADALKWYCEYHPAYWHRFPDTKSARGNFIKAQPGDFFLLVPGVSILIECKSTQASARLLSLAWHGPVGKGQLGKHRLWLRSGHPSLYLYGDLVTGIFEWHSGNEVLNKKNRPLLSASMQDLPTSISPLIEILRNKEPSDANAA